MILDQDNPWRWLAIALGVVVLIPFIVMAIVGMLCVFLLWSVAIWYDDHYGPET